MIFSSPDQQWCKFLSSSSMKFYISAFFSKTIGPIETKLDDPLQSFCFCSVQKFTTDTNVLVAQWWLKRMFNVCSVYFSTKFDDFFFTKFSLCGMPADVVWLWLLSRYYGVKMYALFSLNSWKKLMYAVVPLVVLIEQYRLKYASCIMLLLMNILLNK